LRLCHIVPSIEERHGGPSKSVRAVANGQALAGAAVDILTTAGDCTISGETTTDAAHLRVFPRVAPRWLCRAPALEAHLNDARYDCVHNHALWLLPLRYAHEHCRRQRVPLVIAPRGMMSGWAYQHRRWRKRLAALCVHPGAFAAAAGWHATSPEEADDIRRLGFHQPICVAPNGVSLPTSVERAAARARWHALCPAAASRPVALFYSRFHRKKRLRELVDLWRSAPRGDWLLLVAGLPEEFSAEEVRGWITVADRERVVVFDAAGEPPPYAVASLFLLPSHSENFGLVIAEALAWGVPCLVTDTTPWRGLAEHDAGWCVPWNVYPKSLQTALATSPPDLAARGERGRRWMLAEFSWDKSARTLLNFYRQLAHA
jgi:glycosyltransferase involved in cell wall biosynthesis